MSCGDWLDPIGIFDDDNGLGLGWGFIVDPIGTPLADVLDLHSPAEFGLMPWRAGDFIREDWRQIKHFLVPDMRRDREAMVNTSTTARKLIYGKARVSGQLAYATSAGDQAQFLHLVVILAGHQVDGFESVYLDDTPITDPVFAGRASYTLYDGTQTALSAELMAASNGQWTTNHQLRGCACIHLKLTYNDGAFPSGVPAPRVVVRGMRVYDPRTGLTVWSDNPALCTRHYMLLGEEHGGMGCTPEEVDDASVVIAADICDEQVVKNAGGTEYEPRYTLNGVVALDSTPSSILADMLTAMDGAALYSSGKWSIFAGKTSAPVAPVLDETWLNGGISFSLGTNKNDRINTVKGMYIDPSDHWAQKDFPVITSSAYIEEDGGEELTLDLRLPFTTSVTMAQRLAKRAMEKSRRGLTVTCPCNYKALPLQPNDIVRVNNSILGWAEKEFRVLSWTFSIAAGIVLELGEEDPAIDAWVPGDVVEVTPPPLTNLPDPSYVPPILVVTAESTLYTTITPGIYKSRLDISWTDLSPRIGMYDVEILDGDAVIWANRVYQPSVRVEDLTAGDRQVRVRGVNSLGVPGEWNTQDARVVAKEDPPGPVTNAGIEVVRGQASIYWTAVPDVDVAGYAIQLGTEWDAPGNKALVDGYPGTSFPWTPDRTGIISILIKARDNSGHWSTDAFRLDYQVMAPGKPLYPSARVIDNIVELSWSPAQPGTFPVAYYRIYSGADFATAAYRGRADVNTMVLMEPSGGTYKYWLVAVDAAELAGPETGIYVKVDSPADYVLYTNQNLDFGTCTLTNAVIENGEIVLPVNTTETFEAHFTGPGWDQPQDQIDAGRPVFIQSGTNWANVEKVLDLGAVIAAAKITVSVTRQTAVGTVIVNPRISASSDGTAWSDLADAYEAYTQSFRYVKVLLMCSTFDHGIARIQQISLRLDIKERTALATVNITDTAGTGTEVTFASMGIAPADVIAIIPTAPYTGTASDPITVLPNFTDVPNPTSFRLLAYDKNNARVAVNGVKALVRYVA